MENIEVGERPNEKYCHTCKSFKHINEFKWRIVARKKYPASQCRLCEAIKRRERYRRNTKRDRAKRQKSWRKSYDRRKELRAKGINISRWILVDSKNSDQKQKRQNNLDKQFIEELIKNGCIYCGETQLRMTLDRIDNSIGHLKSNVNPACIRCNYMRRDMPYNAWLKIVPAIRKAREMGLFENWTGSCKKVITS